MHGWEEEMGGFGGLRIYLGLREIVDVDRY